MGLDQFAYVQSKNDSEDDTTELAYWRKHPNLQGWMENLWESKGRPLTDPDKFSGSFNCIPVELTLEDLGQLEHDIIHGGLPGTTGFFFGQDSDEFYKEIDLKFVREAREEILGGNRVFYSSSW